ncbi:helix-turn-helix transcriptional regulator [Spirosoma sp. KCTC 42546]|uniref:helix-turn-helix domain-containing protein n=1 Tax=Spirosoma sp. KCTC 42546 TaxID=2520506 RepID=UPI001156D86F|nr:AraC family transcriptional regulator [Spirosoma sp. KCTC 42546]QDK80706.1 helix-turn-helix transcriptional regulator [Spirosoma sp. KCTC 42546]
MTFYHQQVLKIRDELYANEDLCNQIIRAKLFMDSQLERSLNLDAIAQEASFSKFHFIRLFKNMYGQTPYQYLTTVRIDKAKQLLRADKPVQDVCFAVGFESTSSFTGLFKKMTGSTPTAFIEKAVSNRNRIDRTK